MSGKTKAAMDEVALTMKDPGTFEEAMSQSDAWHWKKACAEELEEFV